MMRRIKSLTAVAMVGGSSALVPLTLAQQPQPPAVNVDIDIHFPGSNVIVPQQCSFVVRPGVERVTIQAVDASIEIIEQVATTTLKVTLANQSRRQLESEMLIPVPDKAAVRSFRFDTPIAGAAEPTARLLPRDEARRTYESIVRAARDPALLEFASYGFVRSSVFPVPPAGTVTVSLIYEQVLEAAGNRIDYILPRTESLELSTVKWTIAAKVRSNRRGGGALATVYSPSHEIVSRPHGPDGASVEVTPAGATQPGAFRLSYLLEDQGVTASLMAYPDPEIGGGYFLLLAGVPANTANQQEQQKREVILVIDRSGSMKGEKIQQARDAAVAILDGLDDGEAFNIIDYSDSIAMFSDHPVVKTDRTLADGRAYVKALSAEGGTNIHDALLTAVRMQPTDGEGGPSMVLFLTDGLPTVGNTSEIAIRDDTQRANAHKRRIFTFGVGYDVNAPLLDRIAETTRGSSINVLPGESVEVAVSQTFRRLFGPVLGEPKLAAIDPSGQPTTRAVKELLPANLPDLFDGDQLVVLGQYKDAPELRLRLTGLTSGNHLERDMEFRFDLSSATTRNAFVPRLWATRKIAMLVDEIRQRGAEAPSSEPRDPLATDPRLRELVEEIVRLSTRFGILTEYTAFLATEPGVKPDARHTSLTAAVEEGCKNLQERAVQVRTGQYAVSQSLNVKAQQTAACGNAKNEFWNANMQRVSISSVQQVCDQTLFLRDNRWVDARLMGKDLKDQEAAPDRTVDFGSLEYFEIARKLADEGRAGIVALRGEVYLLVDGKRVLVKGTGPAAQTDGQ
jgi:Ca-activated chloride channel family protein